MKRWIWFAGIILAIVFYKITWRLLLPFMLALAVAIALKPVVNWLERRLPIGRTAATILVFVLVALIGSGIFFLATASLLQGAAVFVDKLPEYQETVLRWVDVIIAQTGRWFVHIPSEVLNAVKGNMNQIVQSAHHILSQLGQATIAWLGALPGLASLILISTLAGFFVTKDWDWFVSGVLKILPDEWQRTVEQTGSKVGDALGKYVVAQIILISISTVLSLIGLAIIGVDRWLATGLLAGVLDLLPVLGPGLLYVSWAIYAFIIGRPLFGISLLIVYGVVSGVRQIFEAKVLGESLGIHPLIMIFGLYWGALLLGAKGLILAPLILIIAKAYLDVKNELES